MSERDSEQDRPEELSVSVAIVGAGQAGLSMSWLLTDRGIQHVVLEAATTTHEWSESRWDSFTLVTPNWQCQLPGWSYEGPDPHGFMTGKEVVAWLEEYAASFDPPVREHHRVLGLSERDGGGFLLTVAGPAGPLLVSADHVVVATGGYHLPIIPAYAERIPLGINQIHSSQYRSAGQLPEGAVLVVGTGQSGAQIAEDLHLEGRQVHLAVGDAPRCARFHRGRDSLDWLSEMGLYDTPVMQYPGGIAAREKTNHYMTGRDGGRDIDLRVFASEGMRLYGRLSGATPTALTFDPTLAASLDAADRTFLSIRADIDRYIERENLDAPPATPWEPVWSPTSEPRELDLVAEGVTSVVWAIGYRPDYRWVKVGVFDGEGRPTHSRGVTAVPGLSFLGLPWQYTWGSGRFAGVARDAAYLVEQILAS